jgi:hypothetical protein
VVGGATSDKEDLPYRLNVSIRQIQILQQDILVIQLEGAAERIDDSPWLFTYFLEHEVLIPCLFRHDRIPVDGVRNALQVLAIDRLH